MTLKKPKGHGNCQNVREEILMFQQRPFKMWNKLKPGAIFISKKSHAIQTQPIGLKSYSNYQLSIEMYIMEDDFIKVKIKE